MVVEDGEDGEDNNNNMGGPPPYLGEALDLGLGEEALQVAMASVHCPIIIVIIVMILIMIKGTYLRRRCSFD